MLLVPEISLATLRYKTPSMFTLCVTVEWKTFNLFFLSEATNVRPYHLMLKKSKASLI